jgi:hypothetical protein
LHQLDDRIPQVLVSTDSDTNKNDKLGQGRQTRDLFNLFVCEKHVHNTCLWQGAAGQHVPLSIRQLATQTDTGLQGKFL